MPVPHITNQRFGRFPKLRARFHSASQWAGKAALQAGFSRVEEAHDETGAQRKLGFESGLPEPEVIRSTTAAMLGMHPMEHANRSCSISANAL